jgi:hypothetical protein
MQWPSMFIRIPLTFPLDLLTVSHPCHSKQANFLEKGFRDEVFNVEAEVQQFR